MIENSIGLMPLKLNVPTLYFCDALNCDFKKTDKTLSSKHMTSAE